VQDERPERPIIAVAMTNLVFFGHHKCASTWMTNIFYGIQKWTGYRIHYMYHPESELNIHPNARRSDVARYTDLRGVHLIRDPRDVVISGYWSHLKTHPPRDWTEMILLRERLNKVSFADGLFLEMDFLEQHFRDMSEWDYTLPNVLELRYEDVTGRQNLDELFAFLGFEDAEGPLQRTNYLMWRTINKFNNRGWVPFRNSHLSMPLDIQRQIVAANTFERLAGDRRKGQENTDSHYRKGVSGDWKDHFGTEHKDYFKAKFGDLLQRLGYATDNDW
jgi:hypothetical protein